MEQNHTFENLSPHIQKIAAGIECPELTPDDLYQIMAEAYLRKARADEKYTLQKSKFILQGLKWEAQHAARQYRAYRSHIFDGDSWCSDYIDPDADIMDMLDLLPAPDPDESDPFARERILKYVGDLTKDNQKIVKMLFAGYRPVEICFKLGVNKKTLHSRIDRIRRDMRVIL